MIIKSLDQLNQVSLKIITNIKKEDCILLFGEIGVGKTTLTRSLINNFQSQNKKDETEVLSPTFNIVYEYEIGSFKIMHYDLYRINESKELNHLGIFSDNLDSIKIIEWPNLIKTPLEDKLEIYLNYAASENEREIKIIGFGKWKNFENEL